MIFALGCGVCAMTKSTRGGARKGAGRPKSEPTVMVRVPEGCLADVRALIECYRGLNECYRLLGVDSDGQTDWVGNKGIIKP